MKKRGNYPELENMGLYATLFVDKDKESMKKYFSNSKIPYALKNMEKKYSTIDEFIRNFEGETWSH